MSFETYPAFDDVDEESVLLQGDDASLQWDETTQTVSLKLRLKTATALMAVGLMMAAPAQAQVVVGRGGGGPDVEMVAPPRVNLPPEWLRHIPKTNAQNKPYQPNRSKPVARAGDVSATYTAPKPLPATPSTLSALRAPQLSDRRPVAGIDSYDLPQTERRRPVKQDEGLMAAPWSPRSQHVDRPLFPELQAKPAAPAPTTTRHGAVLVAPQLGGAKPVATRGTSTLPPVLTPDLMSSLQQAARDEEAGLPPPVPPLGLRDEGNGVNASSAQDRTQTLGTIERSRVDAIVAAREGRAPRGYEPPIDDTPLPGRTPDDIPLPPAPIPSPVPSSMGYLTPPRGREDELTIPERSAVNNSLAPLDKDEVTIKVEDEAPAKTTAGRRILGAVGDKQKPTVYNAPKPIPSPTNVLPTPVPDAPPAVALEDDKAFKAEGRKLFSAPTKKTKKSAEKTSSAQMSLFDAAQLKAADGSTLKKVPSAAVADAGTKTVLTITPEGAEEAPVKTSVAATEDKNIVSVPAKTNVPEVGAREVKEVPVNTTPFGDKVISTITANETKDVAGATGSSGIPDITAKAEAPKVLGKGPRPVRKAAPKPVVEEPAKAAAAVAVAEDEVRIAVEDAAPEPAIKPTPRPVVEPYVPPAQALRKQLQPQPQPQPEQVLRAPTPLAPEPAPVVDVPPVAPLVAPAVPQEQMYVQTPAVQQGERPRLRTPKLLLQSNLPPAAAPAPAAPVAEIVPEAEIAPIVVERPTLTPPPAPEITPTVIAPPAAAIELRMPTITFGPTDRDLDGNGEAQAQLLAQQLSMNPDRRVTLIAYAQAPNLNEARRVALSRALAIRSRLAESGIQPIRVSIRALGALPPGDRGTPDRVDTIVQ